MSEDNVVTEDVELGLVAKALINDGASGLDSAAINGSTDDNAKGCESETPGVDSGEDTEVVPVEIDEGSDLFSLPGAGPGLVWMLQKSGISDMATLAMADAEQLRANLGLIARILDVDYWIEYAQNAQQ
ncbi:MAG: hypothetical protein QNJ20_10375 [Paracoccaceae bacterium]|nr:hypothetical protein [Paracoccaceae bacterium]